MAAYGDTIFLYRAVNDREFYQIMKTSCFSCLPGGVDVKYFGKDFHDTLRFANKIINKNVVAIIEVEVFADIVEEVGDFVHVDPFLFTHGTVEIWERDLCKFNNSIVSIKHKF